MKLKATLKYQLYEYRHVLVIMYLCVYVLAILLRASNIGIGNSYTGDLGNISWITLFVIGLTSFKPFLKLFSTNGVSRKTLFISVTVRLGITSGVVALMDALNTFLFSHFMNYHSVFYELYYNPYVSGILITDQDIYSVHYTRTMIAQQFLWQIFLCFCIAMIGFFITCLYYRMNTGFKIAVSVGVPTLYMFVFPIFKWTSWGMELTNILQAFLSFASGLSVGRNPYIAMASMFVFATITGVLAWLLVRRANVKV